MVLVLHRIVAELCSAPEVHPSHWQGARLKHSNHHLVPAESFRVQQLDLKPTSYPMSKFPVQSPGCVYNGGHSLFSL
jgi:hypothetical protein